MPQPFGFTGELHSQGLVYLRARWYDGSAGTFTQRDPFGGFPEQPYSSHPYQYGYANPGRWTDASGVFVTERLPRDTPTSSLKLISSNTQATPSCTNVPLSEPPELPDIGYIEGFSGEAYAFLGGLGGVEMVYDLYDLEFAVFGYAGGGLYVPFGVSEVAYLGFVTGWSSYPQRGVHNYEGYAGTVEVSGGVRGVVRGIQAFQTPKQTQLTINHAGEMRAKELPGQLWGVKISLGTGTPGVSLSGTVSYAWMIPGSKWTPHRSLPPLPGGARPAPAPRDPH